MPCWKVIFFTQIKVIICNQWLCGAQSPGQRCSSIALVKRSWERYCPLFVRWVRSDFIIITGLMPRFQSTLGICEFAWTEIGVQPKEQYISHMYVIVEKWEKIVHLINFSNQHARNVLFKGRIQLSPRTCVWINEDLSKLNESIAYECWLRYKGGKVFRCCNFSCEVYVQFVETNEPLKIEKLTDLSPWLSGSCSQDLVVEQFSLTIFIHGLSVKLDKVPTCVDHKTVNPID